MYSHLDNLVGVLERAAGMVCIVQQFKSFEAEVVGIGIRVGIEVMHGSEVVFAGSGVVEC